MLEYLDQIDKELLLYLHRQSTPFLDTMMAGITEENNWIPLYLIFLIALFRQFGWQGIYSMVAVILVVVIADQLTSTFMKPFFGRYRPCHDPEIGHLITIVTKCGGPYGFVSSHAANSCAVSTFFILLFHKTHRYVWWLVVWPILFSYSRIYLGVHYPLDILFGAITGIGIGWLMYRGTEILSRKVPFSFTPVRK